MAASSQHGPAADSPEYWERHWDQIAEASRLNPANAFRRRLTFRLLDLCQSGHDGVDNDEAIKDMSLLDIGCGTGDFLSAMQSRYPRARLAGVDRSKTGLDATVRKIPGALLMHADLEAPDSVSDQLRGWASHAVCSEVLEHVGDPVQVLRNLTDYLKPGGWLVVTVPGGPKSAFDKSIGHHRHYTAGQIRADLEQAGYQVRFATGAGFPMFNLYRLVVVMRGERLSADISGRPSLAARAAMALFGLLLRFTLLDTPWGWQIVALAQKPEN